MIQCRISHFLRDVLTSQNKYNWYPQNRIRWCGVDLFKRSTSSLRSKIWISIRFNLEQPVTSFWQQVSQKNWSAWPLKSTSIKVCQLWAGLRIIQCLSFGFLCVCVVSYLLCTPIYSNTGMHWLLFVSCVVQRKHIIDHAPKQTTIYPYHHPVPPASFGSSTQGTTSVVADGPTNVSTGNSWWSCSHLVVDPKLAWKSLSAPFPRLFSNNQWAKGCLRPWPLKVRGTYKTKRAKLVSI